MVSEKLYYEIIGDKNKVELIKLFRYEHDITKLNIDVYVTNNNRHGLVITIKTTDDYYLKLALKSILNYVKKIGLKYKKIYYTKCPECGKKTFHLYDRFCYNCGYSD